MVVMKMATTMVNLSKKKNKQGRNDNQEMTEK